MKGATVSAELEVNNLKQIYEGYALDITRVEVRDCGGLVLYTIKTASGMITLSEKGMRELAEAMSKTVGVK